MKLQNRVFSRILDKVIYYDKNVCNDTSIDCFYHQYKIKNSELLKVRPTMSIPDSHANNILQVQ